MDRSAAETPLGEMRTRRAAEVGPTKAWREYPRPQLVRKNWTNLNGTWDFAVTQADARKPIKWDRTILVPFAPEASLSGVHRLTEPDELLWYRMYLPEPVKGKRTLLNFEAVDYQTTVFVNDRKVGSHIGGSNPFTIDITDALGQGGNELVVRVKDTTGGYQLRGKQKLEPEGIFYTRVSGIWQTVWLENVSPQHITQLDFHVSLAESVLKIVPRLSDATNKGLSYRATVYFEGKKIGSQTGKKSIEFRIPDAKPWTPSTPALYRVNVVLVDSSGEQIDKVESYTAFRQLGKSKDSSGDWRFTLNGEPIFHWGTLDQGWWPDGLLTPPSDQAMLYDLEFLKDAGFNMVRKHIKVEPRRYYYHCDRIGLMVWQDQVSGGPSPQWIKLAADPVDEDWPASAHQQWLNEYKGMVDTLRNHPSIVVWTPFNEAWGQHQTVKVGKFAVAYDSSRLVNIASGGNFYAIGDIADGHAYPSPSFPIDDKRFDSFIKVVGEFGGHGWPV